MVFYMADRDGNGKVTREELEQLFRAADSEGAGFLSLGDLQEAPDAAIPEPGVVGRPAGPEPDVQLRSASPSVSLLRSSRKSS